PYPREPRRTLERGACAQPLRCADMPLRRTRSPPVAEPRSSLARPMPGGTCRGATSPLRPATGAVRRPPSIVVAYAEGWRVATLGIARRVYYGWTLVLTLGITETISWGVLYYAFTVFIAPMQAE